MIKLFICAPKIKQSAKIATEKIKEIYDLFPFLRSEVLGTGDSPGNFGNDYVKIFDLHSSNRVIKSFLIAGNS